MKIKGLVLITCIALASTAFAAADGAAIFKAKCAMCHGADGSASSGMGKSMGLKALGSLRMEKGYRDYGHDIDNTDEPYEVGLGFAVDLEKPGGFTDHQSTVLISALASF